MATEIEFCLLGPLTVHCGGVIVPVSAGNRCHQAIFMNHASGAVAPEDAEVIQIGDIIWQRAEWRGLVQGVMRPMGVIEVLVLAQHSHQVALVPDQCPVQQLTPAAAYPGVP
jgi:hypothetical protein